MYYYQSGYLPPRPNPAPRRRPEKIKNQKGFVRLILITAVSALLVWTGSAVSELGRDSSDSPQTDIQSGVAGYCIDDYHGKTGPGSPVVAWACNGTQAQDWSLNGGRIENANHYCLSAAAKVLVVSACSSARDQQWSEDGVGLKNLSGGCLSLPNGKIDQQLITASCNLTSLDQTWTPSLWQGKPITQLSSTACTQTILGDRVACLAKREWLAWQTEPALHRVLLSDFTDGNPSEEWCADFVSFIYKLAGAPFTAGERNGWDEYNANNIIYQGFTYHDVSSGYVPKAGDVAYFNYSGGHVEIVVSGGKHPTFIYGDSGTKDPITGNGNMAENSIQSDGAAGQLEYYLSPER